MPRLLGVLIVFFCIGVLRADVVLLGDSIVADIREPFFGQPINRTRLSLTAYFCFGLLREGFTKGNFS